MKTVTSIHKRLLAKKMQAWGQQRMSYYAADMSLRFYEVRFIAHVPAVIGVFTFIGLVASSAPGVVAYPILALGVIAYLSLMFVATMCLRAAGHDIAHQYGLSTARWYRMKLRTIDQFDRWLADQRPEGDKREP